MNSITTVVLILGFILLSGFNDGGNLLVTFVNTRVMNVRISMILAALVVGPLLIGTRVVRTIGVQNHGRGEGTVFVHRFTLTAEVPTLSSGY
jgi:PiT family inorganic phosphate transporter